LKLNSAPALEMPIIAKMAQFFGAPPPDIILHLNGLEPQAINLMGGYPILIPNLTI
jgi:hypothetical protein